jgi:E3 ubiquitin-protein ligase SHPRH
VPFSECSQAGSGGLKALSNQGAPMSMDEILRVLIAKAKVEAEEAQRKCQVLLVLLSRLSKLNQLIVVLF